MTNLDFSTPNVVFAYYLQCESLQKLLNHKQDFSQEINIFRIVYKIKEKKPVSFGVIKDALFSKEFLEQID